VFSASLARTLSERLRGESGWLITEVDRAARRAQQDTNYRSGDIYLFAVLFYFEL